MLYKTDTRKRSIAGMRLTIYGHVNANLLRLDCLYFFNVVRRALIHEIVKPVGKK